MKSIISYFIKYPITANLLMFLIFVFGIVGLTSLRSTFFPEMSSRLISIQAISAGLSPLEVEESITKKIEYKLESVSGVKDITSSSLENISSIYVEMERGANMYVGLQNINNAVDQVNFGVDVEEIFIRKREFVMPTISFSISSDYDLTYLKTQIDRIEDELKHIDSQNDIQDAISEVLPKIWEGRTFGIDNPVYSQAEKARIRAEIQDRIKDRIKDRKEEKSGAHRSLEGSLNPTKLYGFAGDKQ